MLPCVRWSRNWALPPRCVALGGGAFAQANNAALLEEAGVPTIFLDAPVEELFRRCQEQQLDRPLRGDLEEFRRLYESRRPCYLKAAVRIETGGQETWKKWRRKRSASLGLRISSESFGKSVESRQ